MKNLVIIICIGILLVSLCVCTGNSFCEEKVIKLEFSIFTPAQHVQAQLFEEWCKDVETRTKVA
jgi:TRAP-type C4-dicarboxylate transport system substrate-binding protein